MDQPLTAPSFLSTAKHWLATSRLFEPFIPSSHQNTLQGLTLLNGLGEIVQMSLDPIRHQLAHPPSDSPTSSSLSPSAKHLAPGLSSPAKHQAPDLVPFAPTHPSRQPSSQLPHQPSSRPRQTLQTHQTAPPSSAAFRQPTRTSRSPHLNSSSLMNDEKLLKALLELRESKRLSKRSMRVFSPILRPTRT